MLMKNILILILIFFSTVMFSQTLKVEYQKVDGKVRAVYTSVSGSGNLFTIFQNTHPFDVSTQPYLKVARKTSTDWVLASSANPLGFNGVVVEDVHADTFKVVTSGIYATTSAHGLTVGTTYYLNLNGTVGLEKGQYEVPVLKVLDANRFEVLQYAPKEVLEVNLPGEIMTMTPQENNVIRTKGFYDEYDGGAGTYVVSKTIPSGLQVDSATVIQTANSLYAVLQGVFERKVFVTQVGVYKDSTSINANIVNRVQRLINLGNITIIYSYGVYNHDKNPAFSSGQFASLYTINGDSNISFIGENYPKIYIHQDTAQSNEQHFLRTDNCNNIKVSGFRFISLGSNVSFASNPVSIITPFTSTTRLEVKDNQFYGCTPVTYFGDRLHKYFTFELNYVENAPNAVSPCDISLLTRNTFYNTTYQPDRSHAIYAYGIASNVTVTHNYFTRAGGNCLKFRAENAVDNTKSDAIFSNNTVFDCPQFAVDLGTPDSDVGLLNYVVTNNTFRNAWLPILSYSPSGATISNNTISWDLRCTGSGLSSLIGIAVSGTGGRTPTSKGIIISNNTIEDLRNVVWELQLTALPDDGDSLVIGDYVYIFKNSATTPFELAIGTTLQQQTQTIGDRLGNSTIATGGLQGTYIIGKRDVQADIVTYTILLNVIDTINITSTAPINFVRSKQDYRGGSVGIRVVGLAESSLITDNVITNTGYPLEISTSYEPVIRGNIINGFYQTIAVSIYQNNRPIFEDNVINNRFGTSNGRVDFRSNFLVQAKNNKGFNDLTWSQLYYDFFSSSVSKRSAGTGNAENIFWFGVENPTPNENNFGVDYWEDGDQVQLLDGSTILYTFTYEEVGSLETNEFNDKESLIALIDATTEFTCTNPGVPGTTSDTGMFKVVAASSGTAGNNYKIRTISKCRLCGKYLQESFVGGSANPDITVFWTTEATSYTVPTVTPINSGATSLTGVYVDIANSVSGKYYLIKHSNASGTEQFLIKM